MSLEHRFNNETKIPKSIRIKTAQISFKGEKSKTQQCFKDSADINKIMERHKRTGVLSTGDITSSREPMYGDYSDIPDYATTSRKIAKVQQDFMQQSAEVRALCNNEPEMWLKKLQMDDEKAKADKIAEEERIAKEQENIDAGMPAGQGIVNNNSETTTDAGNV